MGRASADPSTVVFEETEYFRRSWITRAVMVMCVFVAAANIYAIYLELRLRLMIGEDLLAVDAVVIGLLFMVGAAFVLLWLASTMRLHVRVTRDILLVELAPLRRRFYRPEELEAWEVLAPGKGRSTPVRVAGTAFGWALSTSRGAEVILHLRGGKSLTVGIQDPPRFVASLQQLKGEAPGN